MIHSVTLQSLNIDLSYVFALKKKEYSYFCFIHLKPLLTSGLFLPVFKCVSAHLSLSPPLLLPVTVVARDMTCLMKLQHADSRTACSWGQRADQTHCVLEKLVTVFCSTPGMTFSPGCLCLRTEPNNLHQYFQSCYIFLRLYVPGEMCQKRRFSHE